MIFAISDKIDNITYHAGEVADTRYYPDLTITFTAIIEPLPSVDDINFDVASDIQNSNEIEALKDEHGNLPEIRVELNFVNSHRCSPSAFLQYRTNKNINALRDIGFAQLYEANELDGNNTLFLVIADDITKYNQLAPLLSNSNIIFRCGFSMDDNIQNYTIHIVPSSN